MNILDENFLESQRLLLAGRPIRARQIGFDFGEKGLKDEQIVVRLRQYRRSTFFTLDRGFFEQSLCSQRYCIVFLDVHKQEAAEFVRRALRHEQMKTLALRLGCVVRASAAGLVIWRLRAIQARSYSWITT